MPGINSKTTNIVVYSINHLVCLFFSNSQSTAVSPLKRDFLGKYFLNDLEYIAQASQVAFNLLEREGLEFALRGKL